MLLILFGNRKFDRGISLIEILIVVFIIVVALTSLLGVVSFSLQVSSSIKKLTMANALAQETAEAVRNFRDGLDWNNDDPENKYDGLGKINTGAAYHTEKSSDSPPKWMLIQGEETVDGFTRKVVFENTMRDANNNIVESGGINDPDTKKATITVFWDNKEVKIITYFTNWQ